MRLLFLEDDVMIGEAVLDLLRAEQYAVDWVKDGEAAESALRTQQYDLVMLAWVCRAATAWRCCAACAPASSACRC